MAGDYTFNARIACNKCSSDRLRTRILLFSMPLDNLVLRAVVSVSQIFLQMFCCLFLIMAFKFETYTQFHAQIKLVVVKFSISFILCGCDWWVTGQSLSMHTTRARNELLARNLDIVHYSLVEMS